MLCPANIFKKFWLILVRPAKGLTGPVQGNRPCPVVLVRFPSDSERVLSKYFPDFPALVRSPLSDPERGLGG